MSNKVWKTIAISLLIGSTALYGHKALPSLVSASRLVQHGDEVKEIRVHLMRDHKLYVEEVTQESSSHPTCKMSRGVLPEPAFQRIEQIMGAPEFRAIQNRQDHTETKSGQDEVWHIAFRDGPTRYFTFNVPQSRPPASFVAWFDDASRVQPNENVPLRADSYRCTLFSQKMADAWQQ
jgi:hypothetical protein